MEMEMLPNRALGCICPDFDHLVRTFGTGDERERLAEVVG
jgi:hypothetical protein